MVDFGYDDAFPHVYDKVLLDVRNSGSTWSTEAAARKEFSTGWKLLFQQSSMVRVVDTDGTIYEGCRSRQYSVMPAMYIKDAAVTAGDGSRRNRLCLRRGRNKNRYNGRKFKICSGRFPAAVIIPRLLKDV